jgi:hypothetical protein
MEETTTDCGHNELQVQVAVNGTRKGISLLDKSESWGGKPHEVVTCHSTVWELSGCCFLRDGISVLSEMRTDRNPPIESFWRLIVQDLRGGMNILLPMLCCYTSCGNIIFMDPLFYKIHSQFVQPMPLWIVTKLCKDWLGYFIESICLRGRKICPPSCAPDIALKFKVCSNNPLFT